MFIRHAVVPAALFAVLAAACSDNNATSPTTADAEFASGSGSGGGGAAISVSCLKSSTRSKISIDGRNLAPGNYTARATSGTHTRLAAARHTVGDEVEFDFDSNPNNIAQGATSIGAGFIVLSATPDVRGEILNAAGAVVRSLGVSCQVK